MLEEELDPVLAAALGGRADPLDEPRPALAVGRLERVVVALDPRPDDEVRPDRAGHVGGGGVRRSASARIASSGEVSPPRPNVGSRCRPVASA